MIKAQILDEFLVGWFVKYLFPYITIDVALLGVTTKEQAIIRSQQLYLVYSQYNMLYENLPTTPR